MAGSKVSATKCVLQFNVPEDVDDITALSILFSNRKRWISHVQLVGQGIFPFGTWIHLYSEPCSIPETILRINGVRTVNMIDGPTYKKPMLQRIEECAHLTDSVCFVFA